MLQIISRTILSTAISFLLVTAAAARQAGTLDGTFGTAGIAGYDGTGLSTLAVGPAGEVFLAGGTAVAGGPGFLLVRFTADGLPDPAFGAGGAVRTAFPVAGAGPPAVIRLIVRPDGRLVAIGYFQAAPGAAVYDYLVARFLPGGALDPAFGTGGVVSGRIDGRSSAALDGTVQPDGRIVVVTEKFDVLRLTADGAPDPTFNGGGYVPRIFDGQPSSVRLLSDGKIVIGGRVGSVVGNASIALARLNADGSFDPSFGDGGRTTAGFLGADYSRALVVRADGRIVSVGFGRALPDMTERTELVGFNADGTVDAAFGKAGFATAGPGYLLDAALQPDGRIVTLGADYAPATRSNAAALRFRPDGTPDPAFSGDGRAQTEIAYGSKLALRPDGKVIVFGLDAAGSTRLTRLQTATDAFSDFDDDDRTDVSVFRPGSGEWWIRRSADERIDAVRFGAASDKLVPADYTGDGKTDLAVWRPESGEWFILRSEDGSYYSFPFGTAGDVPQPADYDGDGRADAAVFRPETGEWWIAGSTRGNFRHPFGLAGDIPAAADYDGDSLADLAVFRPATGQWWLLRSRPGNPYYVTVFGAAGDRPVPADYTGDGRTDLAVWRPAAGEWLIRRSEDDSYYSFAFGAPADLPVPGDYDGDGRADAAVYRPSTGVWYTARTTAGLGIDYFGAAGDTPLQ